MQIQVCNFLQLVGTGDLTVDNAVAGILPGMGRQRFFYTAEHQIQAGIANAVDSHLHTLFVGMADHLVKDLRGKDAETAGFRGILVRFGQIGGSGAQCTVAQHFEWADFEESCTFSGVISRLQKGAEGRKICEISLLIDPDGQFAGFSQLPIGFVDPLPGHILEYAVVIAVAAGDTVTVQHFAACTEHILQFLFGRSRNRGIYQIHGVVQQNAVGNARFCYDLASGNLRDVSTNAQDLQRFAVDRHGVSAGPYGAHRIFGGDFVQIPAVGHSLFILKQILVPAPAQDPATPTRLHGT